MIQNQTGNRPTKWDTTGTIIEAKSFHHIKMRFEYIVEPAQNIGGNLSGVIDTFTHHDVYEYVLELDGAGDIIGG